MAITQTLVRNSTVGDRRVCTYDVTFDNTYVTNGWPLAVAEFPVGRIDWVDVAGAAGLSIVFDYAHGTLRAYYGITSGTTAGAEIGNGANALNGKTVRVQVTGQ